MKFVYILIFIFFNLNSYSQIIKQNAFLFDYKLQIPVDGKIYDLFGPNSSINLSYFIEHSNNLFLGVEGGYMFSSNVKDTTILNLISTQTGAIIGGDGYYANVNLMQRGFNTHLFLGYAIHPDPKNLSGFYFSSGIGYLQYKIFIDTKNQYIPNLNEDYKKGYDQLSGGISTKISFDYKYYSKKSDIQFTIGLNYQMAYTKQQRAYNYNTMQYNDNKLITDKILGTRIGIIVPLNKRNTEEFFYY